MTGALTKPSQPEDAHDHHQIARRFRDGGGELVMRDLFHRQGLGRGDAQIRGHALARAQRKRVKARDVAEGRQGFQVISILAAVVALRRPQVDLARRDAVIGVPDYP